jgi:hypothetical protein
MSDSTLKTVLKKCKERFDDEGTEIVRSHNDECSFPNGLIKCSESGNPVVSHHVFGCLLLLPQL